MRARTATRSIAVANELEGLGRRLVVVVHASPRVSADPKVTGPVDAYANAAQPAELTAFAAAAKTYADEREGPVHGLVAQMFGYDAVPSVAVPPPAA